MTRLTTEWISGIEREIQVYDNNLCTKIGVNLAGLTAMVCGLEEDVFCMKVKKHTIAVVPVSSGEGVISAFTDSVAAIVKVMGCNVFITKSTDVAGIAEGVLKGADIFFMADDNEYISINVKTGAVGSNNVATAWGYVTALEKMAQTLKNKDVLVIGCGIVGRIAIEALKEKEANISVYDKDTDKVKAINNTEISVVSEIKDIKKFSYIVDATNLGGWIHKDMLADNVLIATPGVPLSLDAETYDSLQERVVHDYLEIGTAVMVGLVL